MQIVNSALTRNWKYLNKCFKGIKKNLQKLSSYFSVHMNRLSKMLCRKIFSKFKVCLDYFYWISRSNALNLNKSKEQIQFSWFVRNLKNLKLQLIIGINFNRILYNRFPNSFIKIQTIKYEERSRFIYINYL